MTGIWIIVTILSCFGISFSLADMMRAVHGGKDTDPAARKLAVCIILLAACLLGAVLMLVFASGPDMD